MDLFEKKISSLPDEVSDFIVSLISEPEQVSGLIQETAQLDFDIPKAQIEKIIKDIIDVIIGEIQAVELKKNLSSLLKLDARKTQSIYLSIENEILLPIKSVLNSDKRKEFQAITKPSDSLSHHDILSEIENPTPSIAVKAVDVMPKASEDQSLITDKLPTTAPTLEEAVGAIPNLGGFKPLAMSTSSKPSDNQEHPAQQVADKLGQNMLGVTSSTPKEVFQYKKPDPYHEPLV